MSLLSNMRRAFKMSLKLGLGDRPYLLILFIYAHKRLPRRSSRLFNDYLFFLKASDELSDIMRQVTSDKHLVKEFVNERVGTGKTIETVGLFASVSEINGEKLPRPCVLKPAHGSGSVVFCKEGQNELSEEELELLQRALDSSPYTSAREANYRYLRRRIVCEPMLQEGENIKDYKVFCFRGEPKVIQVDSDRHWAHKRNIYTPAWEHVDVKYNFPLGQWEDAPSNLSEMLDISRALATEFEFVRVDFFISGERLFIGELTHCPESAHGRFASRADEARFSALLFADVS